MKKNEMDSLAEAIASGITSTQIYGAYNEVHCAENEDALALGISSWESAEADELLDRIGDDRFYDRPYSCLTQDDRTELSALLNSNAGRRAQQDKLLEDCQFYMRELSDIELDRPCIIYAGMWCPISSLYVKTFLAKHSRAMEELETMHEAFLSDFASEIYAPYDMHETIRANAKKIHDYVRSEAI